MKKRNCLLLLIILTLTASLSAYSQTDTSNRPPAWVGIPFNSTNGSASQILMNEYAGIVSKYGTTGKQWWKKFKENISIEDKNRLLQIFKQMSPVQQEKQKVAFIQPPQPLKKIIPSKNDLNAWKNEKVYGVWVDGRKIRNVHLNSYTSTAFEHFGVSKLYGTAKQRNRCSYQVNLMTKDSYRKYYKETIANQECSMVFRA